MRSVAAQVFFFVFVIAIVSGRLSPPLALSAGILAGILSLNPFEQQTKTWTRILLQASVVALGFSMNAKEILKAGKAGFTYTLAGISAALCAGWLLGIALRVRPKVSFLISAGTAICGGSAIAALASVTHPDEDEMAMSLGTVFTLNSVALIVFPLIGVAFGLTQNQFGLWSALAIHDTSSVVGAAAKFGQRALEVATVVKLSRALWIFPLTAAVAFFNKSQSRVGFPWFVVGFLAAAIANTWLPSFHPAFSLINAGGHIGLELTLFLIGTGITLRTVRKAGARALTQGVLLWVLVAAASLLCIKSGFFKI